MTVGSGTMTRYFAGVDGGGTRTRVLLVDENLREVVRVEGPASLVDPGRPEVSAQVIAETVRAAANRAGIRLPLAGLWVGVAGVGRESVRTAVESAIGRAEIASISEVGTDVEAAFEDAFGAGAGILVISGTGSIGWGRSEAGILGRVGGWGSLVGDEGSGYAIGLEALRRIAHDVDGRGDQTLMEEAVLAALGLDSAHDIVGWASDASKAEIASLVRVVSACAKKGDAVAGELLVKAVEELEGHVLTLLDTLGPWSARPRVALGGGLLERGGILRSAMKNTLDQHRIELLPRDLDAAMGAARRAERLRDTLV